VGGGKKFRGGEKFGGPKNPTNLGGHLRLAHVGGGLATRPRKLKATKNFIQKNEK
jgi:hypothetical protein